MTVKEQIEQRYGSFELSHDKNVAIVNNIEEFTSNVAIQYGLFRSHMIDSVAKDIVRNNYNKSKEEIENLLYTYFKNEIYGK
jgi:hypothetical protein